MPQMDSVTFLPQVFWLTIVFGTFYLIVKKNILPVLSRILKVRTKKLSQGQHLLLQMRDETSNITGEYETALSSNLKNSGEMLQRITEDSSSWVELETLRKTGKETVKKDITLINEKYLSTAANLTTKKNLVLHILKGL